jgi:tripartite-type tricarboxylate transporter receptor subunit TctC
VTTIVRLLTTVALLILVVVAGLAADEPNYPSKSIRIILGFAPGGAPDALARIVADHLTRKGGTAAVVENRTGSVPSVAARQKLWKTDHKDRLRVNAHSINCHPANTLPTSAGDLSFLEQTNR